MARNEIDLRGNIVVADGFVGDSYDVEVPAVTVAGTTVGPGTLVDVLEEILTLINSKEDAA